MRDATILALALLGTRAFAAPHHHAVHQHKARDIFTTWTEANDVYVEDIHVVTAFVGHPQDPPPQPTATPAENDVEEKIAMPGGHHQLFSAPLIVTSSSPVATSTVPVVVPSSASVAASVIPVVSSTTVAPVEVSPAPTSTLESSSPASPGSGSATGTGPVPGPSNIDTAGSPTWSTSPNSMGKSVIGTANYWRNTWNSSLGPFEWDATLAGNARSTAVDPIINVNGKLENEGGANQMNHNLNPGSMAQCINEGDGTTIDDGLTPFEQAWLGWLCERPNDNIPCNEIGETGHYAIDPSTGQPDTGHADIIQGGYTKIGCYYQDGTDHPAFVGMWTCDFA